MLAAFCLAPGAAASTLTGICPDGSVFVVQRAEAIPCSRPKLVEPHEVPPQRQELLPRPYTWQVFQEASDPNNPYNLVDAARQVRGLAGGGSPTGPAPAPGVEPPVGSEIAPGAVPGRVASTGNPGPLDLGFSQGELEDLYIIVELSQGDAPATFEIRGADDRERLRVSLAHSAAFEARLRRAAAVAGGLGGGPVLVFTALARDHEHFQPAFTFAQGHLAFAPRSGDPRQLGLVQGRSGNLAPDDLVLGYVVLPEGFDLTRPLDVYWHDRHLEVVFRPAAFAATP